MQHGGNSESQKSMFKIKIDKNRVFGISKYAFLTEKPTYFFSIKINKNRDFESLKYRFLLENLHISFQYKIIIKVGFLKVQNMCF